MEEETPVDVKKSTWNEQRSETPWQAKKTLDPVFERD
jgi:hypothetical protein